MWQSSISISPTKSWFDSISSSPTTQNCPTWPRRTSSLYPSRGPSPYPDLCSWFDDQAGDPDEKPPVVTKLHKEKIKPKPVRSSRKPLPVFHEHQQSLIAQLEYFELMSSAVLRQLHGVLGEALLQVLRHGCNERPRRWSTGSAMPRVSTAAEAAAPTLEETSGERKRRPRAFTLRFVRWREPQVSEAGNEGEKKRKRGWLKKYFGIGAD